MRVVGEILLLVFLFVAAFAAPKIETGRCSLSCVPGPHPANQPDGAIKTFFYEYEVENEVLLPGVTPEKGRIKMKADHVYNFIDTCNAAAKLTNVQLFGDHISESEKKSFKEALETNHYIVGFQSNRQVDAICFDPDEPVWVANMKRGVLSAVPIYEAFLESEDIRAVTTDIHGNCETTTRRFLIDADTIGLEETKDLSTCTNDHGHLTPIQADSYTSNSPLFQSPPIFKGTKRCHYEMNDKTQVYNTLTCKEEYYIETLSGHKSTVATTAEQSSKFMKTEVGTAEIVEPPNQFIRSNLVFDYAVETPNKDVEKEFEETINELNQMTENDIKPGTANVFTRLHSLMSRVPSKTLRDIFDRIDKEELHTTKKAKDILFDALTTSDNEGAIRVMVSKLVEGKVSKIRSRTWYVRLVLIKNPTAEIISSVLPLLKDIDEPSKTAYLAISSLAHMYCRKNSDCEKDKAIQDLQEILHQSLTKNGNGCRTEFPKDINKVIVTLKSFGNLGLTASKTIPVLSECIRESGKQPSTEVRVAALEAFRRQPCINQDVFWEILENKEVDSELRIHAYLNLIRCPNYKSFERIKYLLHHEEVNQVASFIWTHLTNLQDTSAQWKQHARTIVSDAVLTEKVKFHAFKHSANYELSNYFRRVNLGGSADSNVIFSPKSFLPRSISFNLTTDVLGRSYNFLEFGVRANGLEGKLEELFGQSRKTKDYSTHHLVRNKLSELITGQRFRRDLKTEQRRETVRKMKEKSTIQPDDELEVSVSIKIFGNELSWLNARDLRQLVAGNSGSKYGGSIDFFKMLSEDKAFEFARTFHVIDSTVVYPTCTGFPMKFSVNATTIVGMNFEGGADARGLFSEYRLLFVKAFTKPSVSIEISGSLVIDAHVTKAGAKLRRTIHSSTQLDAQLEWNVGEKLLGGLRLPSSEKMDILTSKTELFVIQHNTENPIQLRSDPDKFDMEGCTSIVGIEFCGQVQFLKSVIVPDVPFFLAGGTMNYAISMRKTDQSQDGMEFKFITESLIEKESSRIKDTSVVASKFELSFDTPKSEQDRQFLIGYDVEHYGSNLFHLLRLRTPFKKYEFKGQYSSVGSRTNQLIVYECELTVDEKHTYVLRSDYNHKIKEAVIETNVVLTTPNDKYTILSGTTSVDTENDSIELDYKSGDKLFGKPFYLKGVSNYSSEARFKFGTPSGEGTMQSYYITDIVGKYGFEIKTNAEFSFFKNPEKMYKSDIYVSTVEKESSDISEMLHIGLSQDGEFNRKYLFESTTFPKENSKNFKFSLMENDELESTGKVYWRITREHPSHLNVYIRFQHPKRKIDLSYSYHNENTIAKSVMIHWLLFEDVIYLRVQSDNETGKIHFKTALELPSRKMIYEHDINGDFGIKSDDNIFFQWQEGKSITIVGKSIGSDPSTSIHYETHHTINNTESDHLIIINTKVQCETGNLVLYGGVEHGPTNYHLNINHQVDKNENENALLVVDVVLPYFVVNVDGKTDEAKRTAEFSVNLLEVRKIEGKLDVAIHGGQRQVNLDVKLDSDKDPNQKLVFVGTVRRSLNSLRKVEVEGSLQLPSTIITGNVSYSLPRTILNGQHLLTVDLDWDSDKKLLVDMNIDVDNNGEGRRLSSGKLLVSTPYTEERSIVYKTKLENSQDVKAVLGNFKISGKGLDDITFDLGHERGSHSFGSSLGFGFGDRVLKLGLGSKYLVLGNKKDIGFNVEIRIPFENAKAFLVSFDHYSIRSEELTRFRHNSRIILFDPNREVSVKFDWGRKCHGKCLENDERKTGYEVKSSFDVVTPLKMYKNPKGRLWYNRVQETVREGELYLYIREEKQIRSSFNLKRELQSEDRDSKIFRGNFNLEDPNRSFKQLNVDFMVDLRKNKGQCTATWEPKRKIHFETEVKRREQEHRIVKVTSTAVLKTSFEEYPEVKCTQKTVYGTKGGGFESETKLEWGSNFVSLKEHAMRSDTMYQLSSKLNSNYLMAIDGWELNINESRINDANTITTYLMKLGEGRYVLISQNTNVFEEDYGSEIVFNGKFNNDPLFEVYHQRRYRVDSEYPYHTRSLIIKSKVFGLHADGPITLDFNVDRNSFTDINTNADFCVGTLTCIFVKTDLEGIGTSDYESGFYNRSVSFKAGHNFGGEKNTFGIYLKDHRERGKSVDVAHRLTFNEEENRFIGFRMSGKRINSENEKEQLIGAANLDLPNRKVQFSFDRNRDSKGYQAKTSFTLDAKKHQENSLQSELNIKYKPNDLYDLTAKISHPQLKKDILVNSQAVYRHKSTILKATTTLDFSSDPAKQVTLNTELYNNAFNDPTAGNYTYVLDFQRANQNSAEVAITGQFGKHIGHLLNALQMKWKNNEGEIKSIKLLREINKSEKYLHFKTITPTCNSDLFVRWWYVPGRLDLPDADYPHPTLRANFERRVDGHIVRRVYLDASQQPYLNITFIDPHDSKNDVFVLLKTDHEDNGLLTASVSHRKNGSIVEDANLVLSLYDHVAMANLEASWKPDISKDIAMKVTGPIFEDISDVSWNVKTMVKTVVKNYRANLREFIDTDFKNFLDYTVENIENIKQEIRAQINLKHLKEILNYYITQFAGRYVEIGLRTTDQIAPFVEAVKEQVKEYISTLLKRCRTAVQSILENSPELGEHWGKSLSEWKDSTKQNMEGFKLFIADLVESIKNSELLEALGDKAVEIAIKLKHIIYTEFVPEVVQMLKDYGEAVDHFENLLDSLVDMINERLEKVKILYQTLREDFVVFNALVKKLEEVAKKLKETIIALVTKLLKNSEAVMNTIERLVDAAIENLDLNYIGQKFRAFLVYVYEDFQEMYPPSAEEQLKRLISTYIIMLKSTVYGYGSPTYNLETGNGKLSAEFPVLISSQTSIPSFFKAIRNLKVFVPGQRYINSNNRIKESLTRMLSPIFQSEETIIPPYKAYGVIIGHHYITFDGQLLTFVGQDCEYVLAQDAVDGNFSLVVRHAFEDNQRSVEEGTMAIRDGYLVFGKDVIFITDKGQVSLNGKSVDTKSQLPITIDHDYDAKTEIDWGIKPQLIFRNSKGITLSVEPINRIGILEIDGYYFGKTQGILGLYNYEPNDDMRLPNGQIAKDLNTFIDGSSKVSGDYYTDCTVNFADQTKAVPDTAAYKLCEFYFKSIWSKFEDGFELTDPEPYFEICLMELGQTFKSSDLNKKFCETSGLAYVLVSKRKGLDLDLPTFCNYI